MRIDEWSLFQKPASAFQEFGVGRVGFFRGFCGNESRAGKNNSSSYLDGLFEKMSA